MTRAFTFAGAKSSFVTLWQVNDSSTKDLMIEFYRSLFPQRRNTKTLLTTKSYSLRQAKLSMLESKETAHPYYWAGMVGFGDMRPFVLK